ncbi:MAG: HAD-IIIA family hydrolase [Flavobacteriales bacterium]|nr:HAD-IIIA family hydrolase [Flavobacteriales bacterium]MCB9335018.1 HAD-IIIA family hydrolase [Flavobacteriales bacterium]
MSNFKEMLPNINTFIFDVDGVLTNGMVTIFPDGDQIRTMNIKDGYALQYAVKKGYNIAIISGGSSESVRSRLNGLGITDVFLKVSNKIEVFEKYLNDKNISTENVLYMGDDIPDYKVMKLSGVATCPNNAAIEIKEISDYISDKNGGEGCVRDIVEQVLRCQGKWFHSDAHEW